MLHLQKMWPLRFPFLFFFWFGVHLRAHTSNATSPARLQRLVTPSNCIHSYLPVAVRVHVGNLECVVLLS